MIYQSGNISVDEHFARFGSKSYAIDKINSVDIRSKRLGSYLLVALFGFLAFAGVANFVSGETNNRAAAIMMMIAFGLLTWWAFAQTRKYRHTLLLMTSSSEAQAMTTHDGDEIVELRQAIERAMTGARVTA